MLREKRQAENDQGNNDNEGMEEKENNGSISGWLRSVR